MTIDLCREFLGDNDNQTIGFLIRNPWAIEEINRASTKAENAKELLEQLAVIFPDMLLPFSQTDFGESTAICLGIAEFFESVGNNPANFPKVASLLNL